MRGFALLFFVIINVLLVLVLSSPSQTSPAAQRKATTKKRNFAPAISRDDSDDDTDNEIEHFDNYDEDDKDEDDAKDDDSDEGDDDDEESEDEETADIYNEEPSSRNNQKRKGSNMIRSAKKKKSGVISKGIESAFDIANAALKLTKGSVKAAVDLCASKHVNLLQIVGKWRVQQEIEVRKGVFIACPATIELQEDGSVVTTCDGQEYKSEFTFRERPWPRKCTISFQARAFQGPKDPEPVAMFYKGYFKRSIMNPKVILIRGKVYRLSGKLFFKRQEKCGKFKASKRRYSK